MTVWGRAQRNWKQSMADAGRAASTIRDEVACPAWIRP